MKIEVDMYIRTCQGLIAKIINFNNERKTNVHTDKEKWVTTKGIKKASHNIVDLIEIGDVLLINVSEETADWKKGKWICWIYDDQSFYEILNSLCEFVKIDKILTREAFEREAYKV